MQLPSNNSYNQFLQGVQNVASAYQQFNQPRIQDQTTTAQIKLQEALATKMQEYNERAFQEEEDGEYFYARAPEKLEEWGRTYWEEELKKTLTAPGAQTAFQDTYKRTLSQTKTQLARKQQEWDRERGSATLQSQIEELQQTEAVPIEQKVRGIEELYQRGLDRGYYKPWEAEQARDSAISSAYTNQAIAEASNQLQSEGLESAMDVVEKYSDKITDQQEQSLRGGIDRQHKKMEAIRRQQLEQRKTQLYNEAMVEVHDGNINPVQDLYSQGGRYYLLDMPHKQQLERLQNSLSEAGARGGGGGASKKAEDGWNLEFAQMKARGASAFDMMDKLTEGVETGAITTTQYRNYFEQARTEDPVFQQAITLLEDSKLPEPKKADILRQYKDKTFQNAMTAGNEAIPEDQRFTSEERLKVMENLISGRQVQEATHFAFDSSIATDSGEAYLRAAAAGEYIGLMDTPEFNETYERASREYRRQVAQRIGAHEATLEPLGSEDGLPVYRDKRVNSDYAFLRVNVAGGYFTKEEVLEGWDPVAEEWVKIEQPDEKKAKRELDYNAGRYDTSPLQPREGFDIDRLRYEAMEQQGREYQRRQ